MFPSYIWFSLVSVIIFSVFIDIFFAPKNSKKQDTKKACLVLCYWLLLGILVAILIYVYSGVETALEYLIAYSVELSLSIDNIIIFIAIFQYFSIKERYQHKILFIGILSAILFRFIIIALSLYMVDLFSPMYLLFGLLLIYSGYKLPYMMLESQTGAVDKSLLVRLIKKCFHYSRDSHNGKLFFRKNNKVFITPLMLALLAVEQADIIFALDSVPAVLSITKEPFIAFSSNILSILGLRSMYFAMSQAVRKYTYLKYGIGYILVYIGLKMILFYFGVHFSNYISILIIVLFIFFSIIGSIIIKSTAN